MHKVLGLDVGGSAIKYALMDTEATIYEKGQVDTPLDCQTHFIDAIEKIYRKYEKEVEGIAMSLPGNIDSDTGFVDTPGLLTYNYQTNIIDVIHQRIENIPVSVQNDGKCAALAELWLGNLQGQKNGAVLVLGSGIGGGLIANGQLLVGNHFFAGELSFLITNPEDESIDSMFAMHGSTGALCQYCAQLKGMNPQVVNGKKVFHWIEENDEAALQALDHMSKSLATQIFNVQCFIDPSIVCIGGGISKQPLLLDKIKIHLDAIYSRFPFPVPKVQIVPCKFNNDSNLIGALYNYNQHF